MDGPIGPVADGQARMRTAAKSELPAEANGTSIGFERHYSPEDLAALWGLSVDTVRRLFEREPGVLVLEGNGKRYGRRRYRTLRIPASVAERVHRRLSVVKAEKLPLTLQHK